MSFPVAKAALALSALALSVLTACSPREEILEGEREALGLAALADTEAEFVNRALPITLPTAAVNATWTHPGGNAQHRIPHPAMAETPELQWRADIGAGDALRRRINARPVVAGGRVFTMDANGIVAATTTVGDAIWTLDLTPSSERMGQGGSHGLAFGGNTLFINSGFGEIVAVNPATGQERWTQDIDAMGGASATYFGGRLYVSSSDSVGWAIDAESGRVQWQVTGTPSGSGYLGGAGPAVSEDLSIFPFASGELVATFRLGGVLRWNATVLGARQGVAYASVSDIAADPVLAGDRLYVANPAGRLVALNVASGERLWTAREGAVTTPSVAGGSVFLISDQNRLLRLNAATGAPIWSQQLALFEEDRERRRTSIVAQLGPVLAGGQLWVASSDGLLRGFDPASGAEVTTIEMPDGAATAPVVAGGTMYIVTKSGELLAFR